MVKKGSKKYVVREIGKSEIELMNRKEFRLGKIRKEKKRMKNRNKKKMNQKYKKKIYSLFINNFFSFYQIFVLDPFQGFLSLTFRPLTFFQ